MIRRIASLSLVGMAALTACADAESAIDDLLDAVDTSVPDTDAGSTDTGTPDTTGPDTGSDTGTDTGTDTTEPDTSEPDTTPDTAPDTAAPACGDGEVNGDETCDDTARISGCSPGDRCNEDCSACERTTASCGDGAINGTEVCDSTAAVSGCGAGRECNAGCTECVTSTAPACGDGAVNGGELCDFTATVDGCDDGFVCNGVCNACVAEVAPSCGDGAVNGTEACDASALPSSGCSLPSVCNDDCSECVTSTPAPRCGDGNVNGTEVCDGSSVLNSGCTAPSRCTGDCTACEIPPRCGDGARNGAERCDGSATETGCDAGTICAADCNTCEIIVATCGNGAVDGDETCDGATAPDNGCGPGETCRADCGECLRATCGNGAVDSGETCDGTAAASGCAGDALCSADCSSCNTCGDLEITGAEACDFDGIFGDIGTCDIETQGCNNCACGPLRLEVVSATGSATGILGTFTAHVVLNDQSDFTNFALLFGDAEGNLVDYFQSGRDLLVQSRFVPEDNPTDYEWRFTVHMLFPPDEDTYDFVYLVLYGADGTPSNPVAWDAEALFTAPGTDASCDPEELLPWCVTYHSCPAETAVCTDQGEVFSIVDQAAYAEDDAMLFEFTFADDAGDFLPYWTLYAFVGDEAYLAFRSWDEIVDNGDGTYTVSYFIESATENLGLPLAEIDSVLGVVYDRSSAILTDEFALR